MSAEVRVISLHQPWASLIAVGAKSIETRSGSTKYRGRLLIHAAKRAPWKDSDDDGTRACRMLDVIDKPLWDAMVERGVDRYPLLWSSRLPLGAVVASCVLTDCVPIVDGRTCERADLADLPYPRIESFIGDGEFPDGWLELWCAPPRGNGENGGRSIPHEAPFGDFSPGRFAWLLSDVKPTTERCPRCWGTGWITVDGVDEWCPTCCIEDRPTAPTGCEPVPMRGRQGLFYPNWDTVPVPNRKGAECPI